MSRIRTIKPEFWTDGDMVRLPFEARLLYIGMWNFADDYGYLRDEPDRIKLEIFPGDDVHVDGLLDLLASTGRIIRLVYPNGDRAICIPKFTEHQRVDHPTKSAYQGREGAKKVSIPCQVRRDVAQKYGCGQGQEVEVNCYYCGEKGYITWWKGKPGAGWVSFSGLELDHFISEHSGGETNAENIVLACRHCNRTKAYDTDGLTFVESSLNIPPDTMPALKNANAREHSRGRANARAGMEGKGKERTPPLPPSRGDGEGESAAADADHPLRYHDAPVMPPGEANPTELEGFLNIYLRKGYSREQVEGTYQRMIELEVTNGKRWEMRGSWFERHINDPLPGPGPAAHPGAPPAGDRGEKTRRDLAEACARNEEEQRRWEREHPGEDYGAYRKGLVRAAYNARRVELRGEPCPQRTVQ